MDSRPGRCLTDTFKTQTQYVFFSRKYIRLDDLLFATDQRPDAFGQQG